MPLRLLLLLCLALPACGGAQRARRGLSDEQLGSLIDLVPPGPAWVIQARPRMLAEQEAARTLWRSLVTEERERAFAERTGVDPLTVEELVVIELPPSGYMLLVRGPFDAAEVVRRAGERLAMRDVESEEPVLRREGLAGQGRFAYAALAPRSLLVARDAPPQLVAQVLARRLDKQVPRALGTPDAQSLYAEHGADPFVLVAPEKLALEPGTGVALLFARERALAVSVRPTQVVLPVAIDLRGEFPPGAEQNFRALARSLAGAQLGRALGLSQVPERMAVRLDERGAVVTFALEAKALVAGLRMLFFDDMRTLFSAAETPSGLRPALASATSPVAWRTAVERSRSAIAPSIRRTAWPR